MPKPAASRGAGRVLLRLGAVGGAGVALCISTWAVARPAGAQSLGPASTGVGLDTATRPGHLEFSRYGTPGECAQAAALTWQVIRRAQSDTDAYAPERDTLPTAAVAVARACGGRFAADGVPPAELRNLVRLALLAGNDGLARAATERLLSGAGAEAWATAGGGAPGLDPVQQRAWAIVDLIKDYVAAKPARLAEAATLATRLDSLGDAVILQRLLAYSVVFENAALRFDAERIERDGRTLFALLAKVPDRDLSKVSLIFHINAGSGNVAGAMALAALYKGGPGAVDRLLEELPRLGRISPEGINFFRWLTLGVRGVPLPPLPVKYGPDGKPFTWPVRGKVSLFVNVGTFRVDPGFGNYAINYAALRRLKEKYGDALDVTLLFKTQGYVRNVGPLDPAAEADSIRVYFRNVLKLPFTVAVDETPVQKLPDGRLVDTPAPMEQVKAYQFPPPFPPSLAGFCLADAQGKGIFLSPGVLYEAALDVFIAQAIGRTPGGR